MFRLFFGLGGVAFIRRVNLLRSYSNLERRSHWRAKALASATRVTNRAPIMVTEMGSELRTRAAEDFPTPSTRSTRDAAAY
jgi:hypothetical protein